MLIKCPECELQVSDKALLCPHCGYPMKTDKPFTPSRSTKHKRLPNGFGQITEIKNKNLRNRFRVMITVGRTSEGRPICKLLKPQAYFATYNEAYTALVEYNKDPYDLSSIITVEELYNEWSKEFYKKSSVSVIRSYKAAWAYCSELYKVKLREIKAHQIKMCIDNASVVKKDKTVPASGYVKNRMKTVFNLMFDYAVLNDMVDKNPSRAFTLSDDVMKEIEENKVDHIAFDEEELQILWDNVNKYEYVSFILYQCYSGWRPSELCLITLNDVHLDEGYIVSGSKSEAGRNRIVPIHPKVRWIVEKEYKRAKEYKSEWLFNRLGNYEGPNRKLSYARYRQVFTGVMNTLCLSPEHRPHDPRKTFVTLAKKYKMDEYALKRLVGHAIDDLTEAVYTERSLDWYVEEMQKIK